MTSRKRERRISDARFEVRSNDDGTVGVTGYAAVYDSPSHGEVIRSTAFTRSLAQRDNVRFLVNHEGVPLASTRAGTMTLTSDDHGLRFDIPSLDMDNPTVAELVSAIRRGDLYQCSFAMTATDDPTIDGVREVREAKLWDVSGVTFPWYEDTEIGMRAGASPVALRSAPTDRRAVIAPARVRTAPAGRWSYSDVVEALRCAIAGQWPEGAAPYFWLDDFGQDWAVYGVWDYADGDSDLWQVGYVFHDDGTCSLTTAPFEVVLQYVPATSANDPDPAAESDDGSARTYSIAEARALLARR